MLARFPLATALLLALTSPTLASECSTSYPEVDVVGMYYVDNDPCMTDCMWSIWAYQESNGIPGLQRSDEIKDDTKGGTACVSDTLFL